MSSEKYCRNCKAKIPYSAKVCPFCKKICEEQKKKKKSTAAVVTLLIAATVAVIAVFGDKIMSSDILETFKTSKNHKASISSSELDTQENGNKDDDEVAQSDPNHKEIGVEIADEGMNIKIESVDFDYDDALHTKPGEGNEFIAVKVKVYNTESTERIIYEESFSCYADGQKLENKELLSQYNYDKFIGGKGYVYNFQPSGYVFYYEVSKESKKIEFEYMKSGEKEDNISRVELK